MSKCAICNFDTCRCKSTLNKKKKKKRNKNTKKYQKWKARVDYRNGLKEWSKLVQQRDGNRCVVCESIGVVKRDNVQSHHILDKRYYKELSLDINVGITICIQHHKWGKFAAHTNSIWFTTWLQKYRPEQYKWCVDMVNQFKFNNKGEDHGMLREQEEQGSQSGDKSESSST